MLYLRLSELLDRKYINDGSPDLDSSLEGDATDFSLIDALGDSELLNAATMNGLGKRHLEQSSHDLRGVSSTNPLSEVFELRNISLNVVQDIISRIEDVMVSD